MRTWMLFLVLLFVGCQSTGRVETSVTPYNIEGTEIKVVVEFKS